jgi:hypothetical protein
LSETKSDISREINLLISSNDPFGTTRINHQDIRRIGTTSTQSELNNINANRHGANDINNRKIKHRHINKYKK